MNMPKEIMDEHQSFWTPYPEGKAEEYMNMIEKTRKYENRANGAIKSGLFQLLDESDTERPSKKYLWVNEAQKDEMKVYVHDPQGIEGCDGLNLRDRLMHATRGSIAGNTSRRVIIVESMSRRYAELLGVRLDIPPEFFFSHCIDALNLSVLDDGYAVQHGRYWRVTVPNKRSLSPISKEQCGWWFVENGFYDRDKVLLGEQAQHSPIDIRGFVSYWATEHGSGSWTVVLLTDPETTTLRSQKKSTEFIKLGNWMSSYRVNTEVLPSATADPPVPAEHRSLYYSLIDAHSSAHSCYSSSPLSATIFLRRLVRSAWEEYILREEWGFTDKMFDDFDQHRGYHGFRAAQVVNEKENPTVQFLLQNVQKRENLKEIIQKRQNLKEKRNRLEEIRHAFVLEDVALHGEQGQHDTIKPEMERERRLWRRLEAKLEVLDSSLSHHMDEYAQRAAIEESFEARKQTYDANRQARSAGQLTKIATIIVPCTFVASIFSMGGSFAAGEDLFYVYWAVSLPITVALLVWVLQIDIREWWWTLRKTYWRKREARLRGIDLEGGRKEL